MSRIYTPAQVGGFAAVAATAALVASFASLSLSSAAMAAADSHSADRITMSAARMATLVIVSLTIGATIISMLVDTMSVPASHILAGAAMAWLSALSGILYSRLNREGADWTLAYVPLVSATATAGVTIPLGVLGAGWTGMFYASITASLATNFIFLFRYNPFKEKVPLRESLHHVRDLSDYTIYLTLGSLAHSATTQVPIQVIAGFFGTAGAGALSMSDRVLRLPATLIVSPISTVFFRNASGLAAEHRSLGPLASRTVLSLVALSAPPVLLVTLLGPQMFALVFGDRWATAGETARILAPAVAVGMVAESVQYTAVVLQRQRIDLVFRGARLGIISCSLVIPAVSGSALLFTVASFSIGVAAASLIHIYYLFTLIGEYRSRVTWAAGAMVVPCLTTALILEYVVAFR